MESILQQVEAEVLYIKLKLLSVHFIQNVNYNSVRQQTRGWLLFEQDVWVLFQGKQPSRVIQTFINKLIRQYSF